MIDVRSFARSLVHAIPPESLPPALGLFVFILVMWAQPNAMVGSFYDDGVYVTLAKALAEGRGYLNIHLPDAPPGVHYPFLYPAVLSVLWRLWPSFPGNVVLFQIFDAATLGACAWLIARSASRWPVSPFARYLALVLGFSAFPLLTMAGVRFSEPLMLLLLLAAADMIDRPVVGVRAAVAAGALAGLAVLARSIGVSVVGGVALALWFRGERRNAIVSFAAALVVAAPWFVWTAVQAGEIDPRIAANYGTYLTEIRQAGVGALVPVLDFRLQSPIARLVIPALPFGLWYPLAVLLLAAVVWGAVLVWPAASALVGSMGLYVAIVSVWPYVPDRFMWIITPVIALFVAAAMRAAWARGPAFRAAALVLGLAMLAGFGQRQVVSLSGRVFARTAEEASIPIRLLAPAVEAGIPRDAVLATEAEAGLFLYTGRRVVQSALFRWQGRTVQDLPPDTIARYYCDSGVTHIALFGATGGAAPVVEHLRQRGDSVVVPLFTLTNGLALFRFRCPP